MRTLGGYRLTRRLGAGGMGEVWMGRREALGGAAREVAIKLLSADRASNAEARKMFLDEARLSMLLRNSNIVQVHDVDEADDKTCYMVMEFVEGLNLAELNEKMRKAGEAMPVAIVAYIIGEVLKGLAHAHELRDGGVQKTIVHRDISPHNVMLSVYGEVKIMDFGVARVASEETSGVHVKGKLRYMPPEQLRGETRKPTLDLFAVGAMLHELLDGVKFRGGVLDEGRLFGMILDGELPPLNRSPETIPTELEELRQQLLAAKPDDRVQSAREAFRRLASWSGYRDTRFELDELVRRHAGEAAPQSAIPATRVLERVADTPPVGDPKSSGGGTIVVAGAVPPPHGPRSVAVTLVESESDAGASTERTATEILAVEGSDTDIVRVRDSSVDISSGARSKVVSAVLAVFGLGLVITAIGVMAKSWIDDNEVEIAGSANIEKPESHSQPQSTDPGPAVGDTNAAKPELDSQTAIEVASESDGGPEFPPPDASEVEEEAEEPTNGPIKPISPKPAVAKTKVAITLGAGVPWAEIKLGGRQFELDGFAAKPATTSLRAGSYGVAYRMQVGGQWKSAGKVGISGQQARIRLEKSGKVTVE